MLGLFLFKSSTSQNKIINIINLFSRFSLAAFFLGDFIVFWHTSLLAFRFSTILRPVWIVQFQDDIFKTLKAIYFSFQKVTDIFLFFIFMALFWGYMGYNLFSEYASQYTDDKFFVFGTVEERYSFNCFSIRQSILYL